MSITQSSSNSTTEPLRCDCHTCRAREEGKCTHIIEWSHQTNSHLHKLHLKLSVAVGHRKQGEEKKLIELEILGFGNTSVPKPKKS